MWHVHLRDIGCEEAGGLEREQRWQPGVRYLSAGGVAYKGAAASAAGEAVGKRA